MSKTKKILITTFILFNFLTMLRIHLPLNTKAFTNLYRPIDTYLSMFSIYQDWMMFAPSPNRYNFFITADVEFADGQKDTYKFPRTSEMSFQEKYLHGERFRKITFEGIRMDEFKFMWPDAARFALRKMKDTHSDKIPVKVSLVRHWERVPDMETEFRKHGEMAHKYDNYTFYTYEVL